MSVLKFESAESIPGLVAFTSLRGHNLGLNTEAPASEVVAGRRAVWAEIHQPLECAVFMHQVHADHLSVVGRAQRGRGTLELADAMPASDLMISRERGVMLCVGHADCLAVLLADPKRGVVGAAHMGWRGASLNVAAKLFKAIGSDPADLWAGLSPCLGPDHLELSEAQYPQFKGHSSAGPLKNGHFMLDLWSHASAQLESCGIKPSQIEVQRECTACHTDKYYSYRAEHGKTGRMMSCIGLMDPA